MNDTVFTFGGNAPHSNARQKDKTVTGGKGANLAEMASIGLPVPPGFTIVTEECLKYLAGGSDFSEKLRADVADALRHVEETVGKGFGNAAPQTRFTNPRGANKQQHATAAGIF